jgi:hypothetical protein
MRVFEFAKAAGVAGEVILAEVKRIRGTDEVQPVSAITDEEESLLREKFPPVAANAGPGDVPSVPGASDIPAAPGMPAPPVVPSGPVDPTVPGVANSDAVSPAAPPLTPDQVQSLPPVKASEVVREANPLPPLRKYNVYAVGLPKLAIEALDESEAVREYAYRLGISDTAKYQFRADPAF